MNQYQQFIHLSKYARWRDDLNRRETWEETVERYIQFFREKFKDKIGDGTFVDISEAIFNLEVVGSMRALMTAGTALDKSNVAGYNCAYLTINRVRAFDEVLYILMCGTGVGFSVERQYVNQLPEIPEELHETDSTIIVADSKIGWAKAFREVLAYLYSGLIPKWDLSRVRPAGSRLKTFGGRASGPEPLGNLFQFCVETFTKAKGRKLNSLEVHDIVCKIADIVVVGGVRRSALISLSNLTDERMRGAKSGGWYIDNPHRALANNSVCYTELPDTGIFLKEWISLYESKAGERGIFSRNAAKKHILNIGRRDPEHDWGCNPCLHPDSLVETIHGAVKIKNISKPTMVYSMSLDGKLVVKPCSKSWVSKKNAETINITVSSGKVVRCTPNHKIYVVDRGWIEAKDMHIGDRVVHLVRNRRGAAYSGVKLTSQPQYATVVRIEEGETTDVYDITVESTHNFISDFVVVHNCSEILLRDRQLCNLTEVVVRPNDTIRDLKRKVRIATILGTLQSTLTDFRYISPKWKENCEEERLLGVSLTGIMDHKHLSGMAMYFEGQNLAKTLNDLKEVAIKTNKEIAKKLGINQSTAITCVKPSGTVSQLVNSASGIHPRYSKYYIRRVRADKNDPLSKFLEESGVPCEDEVIKPDHVKVFSFPDKAPDESVLRKDMSAIQQLEHWKVYAKNWCEHKPSITVYVRENEWIKVASWVYENFDLMSGVSFLPHSDHIYKQAPYEEITEEQYKELLSKMPKEIDWRKLEEYEKEDNTTGSKEYACGGNLCEIT